MQVLAADLEVSVHGTKHGTHSYHNLPAPSAPWARAASATAAAAAAEEEAGEEGAVSNRFVCDSAVDVRARECKSCRQQTVDAEVATEAAMQRLSALVTQTRACLTAAETEVYLGKVGGHCIFLPSLLLWKHKNNHMPRRDVEQAFMLLRRTAALLWALQLTFKKGFEPEIVKIIHGFRTVGLLQRLKQASVGLLKDVLRCCPQRCGQSIGGLPKENLNLLKASITLLLSTSAEQHTQVVAHARRFAGMATPLLLSRANSLDNCTIDTASTAGSLRVDPHAEGPAEAVLPGSASPDGCDRASESVDCAREDSVPVHSFLFPDTREQEMILFPDTRRLGGLGALVQLSIRSGRAGDDRGSAV